METSLIYLLQLLKFPGYSLIVEDIILAKTLDISRYPKELHRYAKSIFALLNNRFIPSQIKDVTTKIITDCYQSRDFVSKSHYACNECNTIYDWASSTVYMSKCTTLYCHGEICFIEPDIKSVIKDLNTLLRL
jgi:hypothetical protein